MLFYGFQYSTAAPIGSVKIVDTNVINIPLQLLSKNKVSAIAVNTGLNPANPLSISSFVIHIWCQYPSHYTCNHTDSTFNSLQTVQLK